MSVPTDYISPEQAGSLPGVMIERIRRDPDKRAYRHYDPVTASWLETSWAEMGGHIARWQKGLKNQGLVSGDRVGIMLRNCREWVMLEQAALGLGLVVVPLYTNDRAENVAYIVQDAGIKFFLIEGEESWEQIRAAREEFTPTKVILTLDKLDNSEDARLTHVDTWLPEHGETLHTPDIYNQQLATIVYTSGTTGRPKGVMLSHGNILWNAYAGVHSVTVRPDDVFLSFLPLSHMFERTVGHYIPILAGAEVAYARSIPELAEDLRSIRPTILITVPRIFERVYNKIQTGLEEKSPLARKLFLSAVEVGWQRFEIQQGRARWSWKQSLWPLLNALVGKKVLGRLGGRLRFSISGGAPLSLGIAKTFIGLGLPISQGYGLTESSPIISTNKLDRNDPASVGEPLRDVEVKLGEDDELLTRSPGIMLGYWNNEEASAAVVDKDGWLHTGDKARIEDNHIYITGRIKEIIVLANGEKVPPADIELAIANDPLFDQVLVLGEGKPYLSAIVVLNPETWPKFAASLGLDDSAPEALTDKRTIDSVLERIAAQMEEFPGYANIVKVTLSFEPWTVDDGLITPTLKLRRAQITERFADAIEAMYSGH